ATIFRYPVLFSAPWWALPDAPRAFPTRRSSDLARPKQLAARIEAARAEAPTGGAGTVRLVRLVGLDLDADPLGTIAQLSAEGIGDRKSTRLNSSHVSISYAVFRLKKEKR